MNIKFSPPDITESEIAEVVDTLRSGWITTGPKTKRFEAEIAAYCGTEKAVCLNSATAGLELVLRIFGIGEGDEVITSAYTYTASASVIQHVGATIVLCDTQKDGFEMDYSQLDRLITPRTKAIIPVDLGGIISDYAAVFAAVNRKKDCFKANNDLQQQIGRIVVVADAAHSFGAERDGKKSGRHADFTSFSFHAVKNLTTAEGGAVVWNPKLTLDSESLYRQFMLWSLHGQSKDALSKNQLGAWEYDIKLLGHKCNMTDIMAALGLAQLKRYDALLGRRQEMIAMYDNKLKDVADALVHYGEKHRSSGHLYMARIKGANEAQRDQIIVEMAKRGVATNVHYKPLPLHGAYHALGFDIAGFPNARRQYQNEITLPLHTLLTDEEVQYVAKCLIEIIALVKK